MFSTKIQQGDLSSLTGFIVRFEAINNDEQLFPKQCRSCGEEFQSFSEFLRSTLPKEHVFQDCSKVMKTPYTMMYRHCSCGNTLVLALTEKTFPGLNELWATIRVISEKTGEPLTHLVKQFAAELDRHFLKCSLAPNLPEDKSGAIPYSNPE